MADAPLSTRTERARLSTRRLLGLDRSGPPPPQTLAGQPWNPWTLPNAIGFVRLALLPVFLVLAFASPDGRAAAAATVFAIVAWSDYLDGITARLTGQYSRLGALLDPIVDRLLVLSRGRRVLALRAAAPLGAGRAGSPRAGGRWPWPSWACAAACR